jgi:Heterokaryon incompatibility protein (HET)
MRLLVDQGHGNLSLVENHDNDIPHYAILSHTWGADGEEVTFKDIIEGTGKNKAGYHKIEFCRKQAASDGLQHFWVDTCCIDKANNAELTEAINSMFRWYQDASKCYVYLCDVSTFAHSTSIQPLLTTWDVAFRESRWFTRGWTLQELIAPPSVEFFSHEGDLLGSKMSMEEEIHKITGIAIGALRGEPLMVFAVEERMSWTKGRRTKRQEDVAYSLLGIFNVRMRLDYGEGREEAFERLRKKITKSHDTVYDHQLLRTISHIGDAAYDSWENQRYRPCLTDTRVDLLQEITDWASSDSPQYIVWLRGRAGTGKSTIALTMAQTLDRQGATLASFFFKRGGGDLGRSQMVISTIVYQLAMRSRLFGGFVCDALRDYPNLGESASMSQQYDKLLLRPLQRFRQSATQSPPFIVVLDALDECDDLNDIRLLLRLLGDTQHLASLGFRVLATSRPEIPIRLGFHEMKHIAYHELALHNVPRAIVDQDIEKFVRHELFQIKAERALPGSWPGEDKIRIITTRADGLFIYAATVCRYVNGPRQVSPSVRLEQVCRGSGAMHKPTAALDLMYSIVLNSSMKNYFSGKEEHQDVMRLRQVVGSVILLFDNLSAEELARLLFPSQLTGGLVVQETLDSLHAVFDVPEDLGKPIQMLHLSFRDFLVDSARCPDIRFQINQQQVHHDMSQSCLKLMEQSLIQNICQLSSPEIFVTGISEAALSIYLPLGLRYACCHWLDHVNLGQVSLDDGGRVHIFLQQHCPHWLEAMSLIKRIPEAIMMMRMLESLIEVSTITYSRKADI